MAQGLAGSGKAQNKRSQGRCAALRPSDRGRQGLGERKWAAGPGLANTRFHRKVWAWKPPFLCFFPPWAWRNARAGVSRFGPEIFWKKNHSGAACNRRDPEEKGGTAASGTRTCLDRSLAESWASDINEFADLPARTHGRNRRGDQTPGASPAASKFCGDLTRWRR